MKKTSSFIFVFAVLQFAFSQQMHIKKPNFNSFGKDEKSVPALLKKLTSEKAKQHPEFGVLPFNAQCKECVELIDKRSMNTRLFVDPQNANHTYSQSSYFAMHYQNFEGDVWHTIDHRLRPDANNTGIYSAPNQPAPTKCNMNKKSASVTVRGMEFEFSKNLSMYFFDDNNVYTQTVAGNYSDYSVGEEGLRVKNIWNGIDMEQLFRAGEVENFYVIPAPLQIPIQHGWMVIEDHFTIPAGYTFSESRYGDHIEGGKYFRGDYELKDETGETVITYSKSVYVDAIAYGMPGIYELVRNGNDCTLRTLVPVEWLNKADNVYPIQIDPTVSGVTKIGDFRQTGLPSANQGFTTKPASCDYTMTVQVPGGNIITNAYVDLEYQLTYDNTCGTPPLPPPFCTFSQVTQEVMNTDCGTTTGKLICNPANPPFTGTCTTDSNLVPGASALLINSWNPFYLQCIAPQCPDYIIHFTLKNQDSVCGDVCGYLCARGNMWRMTVEACGLSGFITQDVNQICAGAPVTYTAHPSCEVPGAHYAWVYNNGNNVDTIYGTNIFVNNPTADDDVFCFIIDTCGSWVQTNNLTVDIVPAPPADAGLDARLCEGGIATIGGNPTTLNGINISWIGDSPTSTSYLSSTTAANPQVNIPSGTVGNFFYVVHCSDITCYREDTVIVTSTANPVAQIDSSGATVFCANQTVTLSIVGNFPSVIWNTGSTANSITVSQAGNYFAIVTDANGCKDTSNIITISNISVPTVHVFPDTTVTYGSSVALTTDVNLGSASIDSFTWYPAINISCIDCQSPVVTPQNEFQYYGLIIHSGGCSASDSALIRVILPNNYYIPNAFTPNGDGNNDNFFIQSQAGVEVLEFEVFNRWGEKVFDNLVPWDGTYKGKPSPPGVYVYLFKLKLFGAEQFLFRKGSVTLIR